MHPYATNSHERQTVVLWIGILSVFLANSLHWILNALELAVPWYVGAPSALTIAGIGYKLFDKWLWRVTPFHKVGIVKVPNLNGEWQGIGNTSFDQSQPYNIEVKIKQTWTHIAIYLETSQSCSRSLTASLLVDEQEGVILSYEYRNDPKPNAPQSMHSHRGTTVLRLKNADCLEGEYYSGRGRQNYGSLTLRRKRC